ncbi:MAG: histidinol dehydrogenase [Bacteroidota bacterium]
MNIVENPSPETWADLLARPAKDLTQLQDGVSKIMQTVQKGGDADLRKYTKKYDGVALESILVDPEEIARSGQTLSEELKKAIQLAKANIEAFHRAQITEPRVVETMPGVRCWRKQVGIDRVGLYVPGGSAPLFSSVLMLAVPAVLAGCREIVLCTPPQADGKVHDAILYACSLCGLTQVAAIGGAQAIAALTFGTESVPKVDKIFGPGNAYVTVAKQLAQLEGVAIDMPAGPSEVLVCADEGADPQFMAADLLSQAEHGPDSQVVFVGRTRTHTKSVVAAVHEQLATLPRRDAAAQSIANSTAVVMPDDKAAAELINAYAPEHLIIARRDALAFSERIRNAGSVFLGYLTAESMGDYASGTNHTLPTNGYARQYSGVSLDSFCRQMTFQEVDEQGLKGLGPAVMAMARAEGLEAHAVAVEKRLEEVFEGLTNIDAKLAKS